MKRIAIVFSFLVCCFCLWMVVKFASASMREESVWAIDPSGEVQKITLESIADNTAYFRRIAVQATNAALSWNSKGPALPELINYNFGPLGAKRLEEYIDEEWEVIIARYNLRWTPEIEVLENPYPKGSRLVVKVQGKVNMDGFHSRDLLHYEPRFELLLYFRKNTSLEERGGLPWHVHDLRLKIASIVGGEK